MGVNWPKRRGSRRAGGVPRSASGVRERGAVVPGRLCAALAFASALFTGACATGGPGEPAGPEATDRAWWADDAAIVTGLDSTAYAGIVRSSHYVTMRDGVRIAVDVYLPEALEPGTRLPAILHQTRYGRSYTVRWPFGGLLGADPYYTHLIEPFVRRGYAVVYMDVRGSGASSGHRRMPWDEDEIRDGAEVVDWMVAQPWSNGVVGATGVSYGGTSAELLVTNRHPAVKAAAPLFSEWDLYTDVAFPGGLYLSSFVEAWGANNAALDRNEPWEVFGGWKARLAGLSVRPVDGDEGRERLEAAVLEHAANYDVHAELSRITFRDDTSTHGWRIDDASPFTFRAALAAAGIPIYRVAGWFDGPYQRGAIHGFLSVPNPGSRLLVGPWSHGGLQNASPHNPSPDASAFDITGELLRFFDYHLKGIDRGFSTEPPIHYFTMGEERWKAAWRWPVPGTEAVTLFFGAGGVLEARRPEADRDAADVYRVDPDVGSGNLTRYNTILGGHVHYAERAEVATRLLTYTSPPLPDDAEVTGHPVVTLYVTSDATDGTFFVYLEDVDEAGRVTYVTEGLLRAVHRRLADTEPPYRVVGPHRTYERADALPLVPGEPAELVFDLLPTSYVFRRGHRIRVSIAGADADHFPRIPETPPTIRVHRSPELASRIRLPVVPSGARSRAAAPTGSISARTASPVVNPPALTSGG